MKTTIIILLSIIIYTFVSCKDKNDLQLRYLRGKVKSVTESCYHAVEKFGELMEDSLKDSTYSLFNEKGFFIERNAKSELYTKDKQRSRYVYKYNNNNNLTSLLEYNSKDRLIGKSTYEYENDGRLIEQVYPLIFDDALITAKMICRYSDDGSIKDKTLYNQSNDSILGRIIYKYNKNGLIKEEQILYLETLFLGFELTEVTPQFPVCKMY